MAKVISMINLKGGVAKTTTTIQLAECLTSQFGKRVLVIDLDPQTNATIALISEERWEELDKQGDTLYHLFRDKLEGTTTFRIEDAIQTSVSNLKLPKLSLLASSIRFIDVQDLMTDIPAKSGYSVSPMEVLRTAVSSQLDNYDYVLIDCPPNLGFITRNGIEISDYYLIPTVTDTLSTYGVPQIVRKIHEFSTQRPSLKIRCLGLVATKFMPSSSAQQRGLANLPARFAEPFDRLKLQRAPIFATRMPQANATAEAMDFSGTSSSFKEKYGYQSSGGRKLHEYVTDLTREFIHYVGA
jgi:chromosome partitioning protein